MSASKRKGTAFETAVVGFLQAHGFPGAERRALAGNLDKGDIALFPEVVLECKATQRIALAEFVEETEVERQNARAMYGVTIVKRRNRNVGEAYAVMPLHQFTELLGLLSDRACTNRAASTDDAAPYPRGVA